MATTTRQAAGGLAKPSELRGCAVMGGNIGAGAEAAKDTSWRRISRLSGSGTTYFLRHPGESRRRKPGAILQRVGASTMDPGLRQAFAGMTKKGAGMTNGEAVSLTRRRGARRGGAAAPGRAAGRAAR